MNGQLLHDVMPLLIGASFFGATARDEIDLERLNAELLHVVDKTMELEFVRRWLHRPERDG
jgi:hypothetical protein